MTDGYIPPDDEHGEHFHFDDEYAFDEHWRNWIDNPPLAWKPPDNVPMFSKIFDVFDRAGWIVRLDAWIDAQGVHMHFRWVVLVQVPDQEQHKAWIDSGQDDEFKPTKAFTVAKRGVVGMVLNWMEMVLLEERQLYPKDEGQNGDGGELSDANKREM